MTSRSELRALIAAKKNMRTSGQLGTEIIRINGTKTRVHKITVDDPNLYGGLVNNSISGLPVTKVRKIIVQVEN